MANNSNESKPLETQNQKEYTGLKKLWYDRSPVLRFILVFILLMALFYIVLWNNSFFHETIVANVTKIDANIASLFLNLFGYGTEAIGSSLSSPQMTVNVKTGCDGIEGMALFTAGVIAYTASMGHKIRGILAGVLFLFAVNILRIIHLWLTGLYFPKYFEFFHQNIWQIVFILVSISTWAFWISKIKPEDLKSA